MAQNTYYLVEAVNIYDNIFDTDQLSVVRGGSLLIKKAIEDIENKFAAEGLESLTKGASSGLFFKKGEHTSLCGSIQDELTKGDYAHFAFAVVSETSDSNNLAPIKDRLITRLRFQQLESPTLPSDNSSVGKHNNETLSDQQAATLGPCEYNGFRAITHNGSTHWCPSVEIRRKVGMDAKMGELYADALKTDSNSSLSELRFTNDLHQLTASKKFPKLNNKMAVIYFDGNSFGKIQKRLVKTHKQQKDFDEHIQKYRNGFLQKLLSYYQKEWKDIGLTVIKTGNQDNICLRLETLLWGGDEMILVVPAWLGMDVVKLFYETSMNWKYEGQRLTHAGGLVFCHTKTPIAQVKRLAQELADKVKSRPNGRKGNFFDYMVLESVDYPVEGDLNKTWSLRYDNLATLRQPLPGTRDADKTHDSHKTYKDLKEKLSHYLSDDGLSRRQLYRLVAAIRSQSQSQLSSADDNIRADIKAIELKLVKDMALRESDSKDAVPEKLLQLKQLLYRLFLDQHYLSVKSRTDINLVLSSYLDVDARSIKEVIECLEQYEPDPQEKDAIQAIDAKDIKATKQLLLDKFGNRQPVHLHEVSNILSNYQENSWIWLHLVELSSYLIPESVVPTLKQTQEHLIGSSNAAKQSEQEAVQ